MKKILCGIMLVAACAGGLAGYYEVSSDPRNMSSMRMEPKSVKMVAPRSRSIVESDIKDTEKKIHDLDKKIGQERNTVKKMDLQKQRASHAKHLNKLEDELKRAK